VRENEKQTDGQRDDTEGKRREYDKRGLDRGLTTHTEAQAL